MNCHGALDQHTDYQISGPSKRINRVGGLILGDRGDTTARHARHVQYSGFATDTRAQLDTGAMQVHAH